MKIPLLSVLNALDSSKVITWHLSSEYPIRIRGWQANSLTARSISADLKTLPAFEMRLLNTDGILLLSGY
jgi:hypothetical protein